MSRYDTNCEGMTFEEWTCAAGLARFGLLTTESWTPYTVSFLDYRSSTKRLHASRTMYPAWIRKAWREGVDPGEYRQSGKILGKEKHERNSGKKSRR